MSWRQCKIEMAAAVNGGASMPTSLVSIGVIKDKSTTLEPSDGDTYEMKATGGKTVAKETGEGGLVLKTRVIEPSDALYTTLGLGAPSSANNSGGSGSEEEEETTTDYNVKTHVVAGNFGVKLTAKNIGARGLKIPFSSITAKPGYSEEDGQYIDLEYEILQGAASFWYQRFTVAASDWA